MRYFKVLSIVTFSMIALFLIVAVFMPSEFLLERTVSINKPITEVFEQVADLNNFNKWNSWTSMEPSAYKPVEGSRGVGQVSAWDGDTVGVGSLKVTRIDENSFIGQEITFLKPWESQTKLYFKFRQVGEATEVTWGMDMKLSYPFERIMRVKLESELGKSFNEGLSNLKKLCEQNK
ncbi:hypothetical protein MASR1M45_23560 [Candidatus Kapaibacterium sp.]